MYLECVLTHIAEHKIGRIDELLHWNMVVKCDHEIRFTVSDNLISGASPANYARASINALPLACNQHTMHRSALSVEIFSA